MILLLLVESVYLFHIDLSHFKSYFKYLSVMLTDLCRGSLTTPELVLQN